MTFTADGKRQRLLLIFYSFPVILKQIAQKWKVNVSLTIHSQYKYFDSTVKRAEDGRQKFHFLRLPFAVNVMLKAGVNVKAALTSLNTEFLPISVISRSHFKRR